MRRRCFFAMLFFVPSLFIRFGGVCGKRFGAFCFAVCCGLAFGGAGGFAISGFGFDFGATFWGRISAFGSGASIFGFIFGGFGAGGLARGGAGGGGGGGFFVREAFCSCLAVLGLVTLFQICRWDRLHNFHHDNGLLHRQVTLY